MGINYIKGKFSRKNILIFPLILFTCIQVINLIPQTYSDLIFIRQNIGQSAINRGSRIFGGNSYGAKVEFLALNVPENIDLVLPPEKLGISNFGSSIVLEYYLAPRKFESCGSSYTECIENYKDSHAIIYFNQAVDISQTSINSNQIIMMDDDFGVIVPESALPEIPLSKNNFDHIEQVLIDLGAGILFLLGFTLIGYLLLDSFFPQFSFLVKFSLGFGIGAGFYSFLLYIVLIFGIPLSPVLLWGLYALFLLLSVGIFIQRYKKQERKIQLLNLSSIDWYSLPIFVLGGIVMILAFGKGYFQMDGIILWGSKGFGIAYDGLIKGVSDWGTTTASYPLNIPLLIATIKILFNDLIPQSKLIFPFYYLSLLLFVYGYLKSSLGKLPALLSALLLGTIPAIFVHGTIAYANLAAAYYFCAGIFLLNSAWEKGHDASLGRAILGSVLISLGAWTRPETLTIGVIIILVFAIVGIKRWPRENLKKYLFWTILPFMAFLIVWKLSVSNVYLYSTNNDTAVLFSGLKEFLSGNFHIREGQYLITYFFKTLFSVKLWGFLGYSSVLFMIYVLFKRKALSEILLSLTLGIIYIIFVIGSYHLLGYQESGDHDISWWVTSGLMRMALPGLLIVWVSLVKNVDFDN